MVRAFRETDRQAFYDMAELFHNSNAVEHNTPQAYFELTFNSIMAGDPLVEGYIIESDGETAGYGLLFVFYSNEFGGLIYTWDEIYIKPEYRGQGLGTAYIHEMEDVHRETAARFRLECEDENVGATRLYLRLGYSRICYRQMFKFTSEESPHEADFAALPNDHYRHKSGYLVRPFRPDERNRFLILSYRFYSEALENGSAEQLPDERYLLKTFDLMISGSPYVQGYVVESPADEGQAGDSGLPADDIFKTEGNTYIAGYGLAFPSFANEAGGSEIRFDETYFLPQYRSKASFDLMTDFFEMRYKKAAAHRMQLAENDKERYDYFAARGYEYLEYFEMLKASSH